MTIRLKAQTFSNKKLIILIILKLLIKTFEVIFFTKFFKCNLTLEKFSKILFQKFLIFF